VRIPRPRLRVRHSLATQVLALLTIALLPLGLIAVYQTSTVIREARALAERDILARTNDAARAEYAVIRRANGAGYALGAMALEVGADSPLCAATMARFVETRALFSFAGFIRADGLMTCASTGEPVDFSNMADWQGFVEAPREFVTVNAQGAVTGEAVLIVSTPIFDDGGALAGASSISIPRDLANTLLDNDIDGFELALMNADGAVLSATGGSDPTRGFDDLGLVPGEIAMGRDGFTMNATTTGGIDVTVALVKLADTELYILGKWQHRANPPSITLFGATAPVFPILMWAASLFVAYLAIDRMVLRHLRHLRRRMATFSIDDPDTRKTRLDAAPQEIQQIATSYDRLVDRVVQEHAAVEASLAEKDILLKEVHHRVKNNLQLIASILNMQLRSIDAPEAIRVLRRVQDRVMSLATIHKSLYAGDQVDSVLADTLLREIINSVLNVGVPGGMRLDTEIRLDPVELDPDQAVPLSLLVTEAVTNAVKYAAADGQETPRLTVTLTEADHGQVTLRVRNSKGATQMTDSAASGGTGLGNRLITAFVSQLGGESRIDESDAAYTLTVEFHKFGAEIPAKNAAE